MNRNTPAQCHNCRHYEGNYDADVGMFGPASCGTVPDEEEGVNEQIGVLLERILFSLSAINNCPMHEAKAIRSDIRYLRAPTTAP